MLTEQGMLNMTVTLDILLLSSDINIVQEAWTTSFGYSLAFCIELLKWLFKLCHSTRNSLRSGWTQNVNKWMGKENLNWRQGRGWSSPAIFELNDGKGPRAQAERAERNEKKSMFYLRTGEDFYSWTDGKMKIIWFVFVYSFVGLEVMSKWKKEVVCSDEEDQNSILSVGHVKVIREKCATAIGFSCICWICNACSVSE